LLVIEDFLIIEIAIFPNADDVKVGFVLPDIFKLNAFIADFPNLISSIDKELIIPVS
jgi:hypothetical protein